MRGAPRKRLQRLGMVMLVVSLATAAVVTMASKGLGWRNYWGGFVYAPFALIMAMLLALAMVIKRNRPTRKGRPRARGAYSARAAEKYARRHRQ